MENPTTFTLADLARIIKIPGVASNFANWLIKQKYLERDLVRNEVGVDAGWFLYPLMKVTDDNGDLSHRHITRMTINGLNYFSNRFRGYNHMELGWKAGNEVENRTDEDGTV